MVDSPRALPAVWAAVGFEPCSPEQTAVLYHPGRFVLAAGGERAGKSFISEKYLLLKLAVPNGLFWIVGPDYEQTKAEMAYLVEDLSKIGALDGAPNLPSRGSQRLVTQWGAVVETRTSAELMRLASKAPDGILMTEAGQQTYQAWLKCRGRVAEKRGWVLMSGTFEGSLSWYPQLFKRWQAPNPEGGRSFSIPTWSNRVIYPGGRFDPEILLLENTYPSDLFLERFAAIPCPPSGLVFKEFDFSVHVQEWCTYDPNLEVQLWIDPGYNHAYACIAAQQHGSDVWCIDEVYGRGLTTEDVIARVKRKPWYRNVTGGVIDIAGRQHQGLPSHIDIWLQRTGLILRSNTVPIQDGIERTRTILRDPRTDTPRIYFNPGMSGTLDEFGRYRYPDEYSDKPIDRDNDAMKALAYGLYDTFGPVERRPRLSDPGHDPFGYAASHGAEIVLSRNDRGQLLFEREPLEAGPLQWR